ncbi:dolichyl-diphosphooligosaccharide--protein glycosyltransferase subunit 1 [Malassezia brasiliensis]|uniref:Dolichyl-diphosphooligosaccharide--protein glycosyltransferase subunit 1 n=1 Tax=Malassezia brasiliensis TaxID=1821822 RepID=A0AAF0DTY0_9BASI|nr:dolichyl-diphosphooligosaccharide--protein glycosyltransferase subunit 1 [Malassezia brasiliensis]
MSRNWMYVFLLALVCAAVAQCKAAVGWTQKTVVKQVELGGAVTQIEWDITAQPTGEVPAYATDDTYPLVLYLSEEEERNIAYIRASASLLSSKKDSLRVPVERGGPVNVKEGKHWYAAMLPRHMVQSGADIRLRVFANVVHDAQPLPKAIAQSEKQLLLWSGDVSLRPAYPTQSGTVVIKTPNTNVVSFSPKDGAKTKPNAITYGPLANLPAFVPGTSDVPQGRVHYEFDRPVLTFVDYDRHVEISHWGDNMATSDTIWMRNDGPKLKGHFNRAKHMVNMWSNPSVEVGAQIHSVPVLLPPAARDVYYVDATGNVSTSRFGPPTGGPLMPRRLDLQPRFPVLGGWNYTFTVGWNQRMSTAGLAKRLPGSHRFRVAVPFLTAPVQTAVDHAKLRIVLPEGAKDIDITLPFDVDSESIDVYPTYLDTIRRPAVVLERARCTAKLNGFVYVDYTLSPLAHFRKVLAVAVAAAALFFIAA